MKDTSIAWCHSTFNPWRGCTKVSAGCANCYAETQSKRNPGTLGVWGPQGTRVVASESMWREPVKWDREALRAGERRRVFCASLADVFEEWKGPLAGPKGERLFHDSATQPWCELGAGREVTLDHVRARLFRLIHETPNLDWLLLTKRPENIQVMLARLMNAAYGVPQRHSHHAAWLEEWLTGLAVPRNVWLGASIEDQANAYRRIPELIKVPAAVRFLSVEPILGPVDLAREDVNGVPLVGCRECGGSGYFQVDPYTVSCGHCKRHPFAERGTGLAVHWVIVGGESGGDARPCRVEWLRSLVRQCQEGGLPVFVKQLGANVTTALPDGETWPGHDGPTSRVQFQGDGFGNYHVSGLKDRKGGEPSEWPEELRVRQWPGEVTR